MIKKILKYSGIIIIGTFLFLWLFKTVYDKIELKKEKEISYILTDIEKSKINNGDIILRYGHGLVSDYIVNKFNEEFTISHCGIVAKEGDKIEVIHSESSSYLSGEGIQKQDFDEFTDAGHKNSVIIVRFNKCKEDQHFKITERAKYYLKKKIPFDYGFNVNDTSVMYCSEIIWHIFKDEFNTDIFSMSNGKPEFTQFKNFWDKTNFDIILNHQK